MVSLSPPLALACILILVVPKWPIDMITNIDFQWLGINQKLMLNFGFLAILGLEGPPLGSWRYVRGPPGGHLRVPGPSTNPTPCPNFRHHVLFCLGPLFDTPPSLSLITNTLMKKDAPATDRKWRTKTNRKIQHMWWLKTSWNIFQMSMSMTR